jgi:hypothetical protein
MLALRTRDENGRQHTILDARNHRWTSLYSDEGSGFGVLTFDLNRSVDVNHLDIGFGYKAKLSKHLRTILFDGKIYSINSAKSDAGDTIKVEVVGAMAVSEDDEIWQVFCDTRLDMWRTPGELPAGDYRPDSYSTGSNDNGLYLHPNSGTEILDGEQTRLRYDFPADEVAHRFKCDFSLALGAGVLFEGDVASVDLVNFRIYYDNDAGEDNVRVGMTLHNLTKGKKFEIVVLDRPTNYFQAAAASLLTGWEEDDELIVYGPLVRAQITDIAADVITYTDVLGEGNLANGQKISNINKKSVATIQSFNAGADQITVTDEDHLSGWAVEDIIIVGHALFTATMNGAASGTTITYTGEIGERSVSSVTASPMGWIVYNSDQDEFATVDDWTAASSFFDVTVAGDVSGWVDTDNIYIYAPVQVIVRDSAGTMVWPVSDAREGSIPHDRTTVNVTTTGTPDAFEIVMECLVDGEFPGETIFALFSSTRVYSTEDDVTAADVARYALGIMSVAGHGWDSSELDIETSLEKIVEPTYFEFETVRAALTMVCRPGNTNDDAYAWGIRLDDRSRFFLETQSPDDVNYIVQGAAPIQASLDGKVGDSVQQVRARYTGKLGYEQVTDWVTDTDAYFAGSYRRKAINLDTADTDTEALALVQIYLDDNKAAKQSSRFSVRDGAVFTRLGMPVAIEEVKARGGSVIIKGWRFGEAGDDSLGILRRTKKQIVAVEIDYENRTASLSPAGVRSTFTFLMGELSRISAK